MLHSVGKRLLEGPSELETYSKEIGLSEPKSSRLEIIRRQWTGAGEGAVRLKKATSAASIFGSGLGRVGGGEPPRMGGDQVGLHQNAGVGVLGQEVDMHLVGAAFGALVAEMGKIEGHRVVLGLPE